MPKTLWFFFLFLGEPFELGSVPLSLIVEPAIRSHGKMYTFVIVG